MAPPTNRCAAIAAKLRTELQELNVRHKPDNAPREFITPTNVKSILGTGPIEQLFLCPCSNCQCFSGCEVGDRRGRYIEHELANKYATIFALLLTENCPGLIYEFQKRKITLDQRLYKEQIMFLEPLLIKRLGDETLAKDVVYRILANQFRFYAQPFEIRNVQREIEPREALPIDEDKKPVGEGSSAEVFAFKILEEYKGDGYKDLKIQKFARKVFKSKKQSSGLDEWCTLLQILNLIGQPHPHIVETFGAFQYGDTFSIIFPLAERSLEGYFQREKAFTSNYVWAQMQGLAAGLAFLHGLRDENVEDTKGKKKADSIIIAYHLDLKPENILLVNGKFQIADFGLSTVKNKLANKSYDSDSGDAWSRGYMVYAPPEHLRPGRKYYAAHDLWSLGAIFSEMATHDLRPTGKAQESLYQYRKDLQIDKGSQEYGSRCFHNNIEMKEAVRSQHRTLSVRALDNPNSDDPDQSWHKSFYNKTFFKLISQMLDVDPINRGTALHAAKTLESLRADTEEQQKNSSPGRANQWVSSFKTVWEQVETGKLQRDYDISPETPYLKASWQIRGSHPRLCECVTFFEGLENGEDLSIHVIRHHQPEIERPNMTKETFIVNRDTQNIDSGMVPSYATRPTEANTEPHGRSGITILGRRFEETFYFNHLQEAYDFQRLLIQQYAVSRFYKISEVTFTPKWNHSSKTINKGDIFLQLWSNHDLSGSRQPRYEDMRHIARVAILASDQLYLVRIWNDFKLPTAANPGPETNPVILRPNHGDLNTLSIKTNDTINRSNTVSHKIPIPLKAPKGYDTKFKRFSIKFTEASDIPEFWRDLEKLQQGQAPN